VGLVGEAAVESALGEWVGGADDEVAGFLDAESMSGTTACHLSYLNQHGE